VIDLATDQGDLAIVRSAITLAHDLNLHVIAEGVEDRASWDLLAKLGCDAAQGYYLSPPQPAAEMECWFRESPWATKRVG
jgi:EAL domain-containing protein (putative c-di-GMP-specific phosphodiesterase class I)